MREEGEGPADASWHQYTRGQPGNCRAVLRTCTNHGVAQKVYTQVGAFEFVLAGSRVQRVHSGLRAAMHRTKHTVWPTRKYASSGLRVVQGCTREHQLASPSLPFPGGTCCTATLFAAAHLLQDGGRIIVVIEYSPACNGQHGALRIGLLLGREACGTERGLQGFRQLLCWMRAGKRLQDIWPRAGMRRLAPPICAGGPPRCSCVPGSLATDRPHMRHRVMQAQWAAPPPAGAPPAHCWPAAEPGPPPPGGPAAAGRCRSPGWRG